MGSARVRSSRSPALATTPTHDESGTPFATASSLPGVDLTTLPINPASYATYDTNFPTDTTAANYLLINNITVVKQNEVLTYMVSPVLLSARGDDGLTTFRRCTRVG
jgi:hypothetical protein